MREQWKDIVGYNYQVSSKGRIRNKATKVIKKSFINDIPFDQLIDEHSGNVHWVHIGYKNSRGEQRKEIKVFKNGKYEKI